MVVFFPVCLVDIDKSSMAGCSPKVQQTEHRVCWIVVGDLFNVADYGAVLFSVSEADNEFVSRFYM